MTPDQRETLNHIRSGGIFGDGTVFQYLGRNCTDLVQWAIDQGYAQTSPENPWEPVNLTKAGVEALKAG